MAGLPKGFATVFIQAQPKARFGLTDAYVAVISIRATKPALER